MTPADVSILVIPQRGLTKGYQNQSLRSLSGSNYPIDHSAPNESREGIPLVDADGSVSINEPLVEMQDVCIRYGDKEVLGGWKQEIEGQTKKGLSWIVRRGERWGVFGPNGMYLVVLECIRLELMGTRIRKNNARLLNLL